MSLSPKTIVTNRTERPLCLQIEAPGDFTIGTEAPPDAEETLLCWLKPGETVTLDLDEDRLPTWTYWKCDVCGEHLTRERYYGMPLDTMCSADCHTKYLKESYPELTDEAIQKTVAGDRTLI
jgi:hypothetical protein